MIKEKYNSDFVRHFKLDVVVTSTNIQDIQFLYRMMLAAVTQAFVTHMLSYGGLYVLHNANVLTQGATVQGC